MYVSHPCLLCKPEAVLLLTDSEQLIPSVHRSHIYKIFEEFGNILYIQINCTSGVPVLTDGPLTEEESRLRTKPSRFYASILFHRPGSVIRALAKSNTVIEGEGKTKCKIVVRALMNPIV